MKNIIKNTGLSLLYSLMMGLISLFGISILTKYNFFDFHNINTENLFITQIKNFSSLSNITQYIIIIYFILLLIIFIYFILLILNNNPTQTENSIINTIIILLCLINCNIYSFIYIKDINTYITIFINTYILILFFNKQNRILKHIFLSFLKALGLTLVIIVSYHLYIYPFKIFELLSIHSNKYINPGLLTVSTNFFIHFLALLIPFSYIYEIVKRKSYLLPIILLVITYFGIIYGTQTVYPLDNKPPLFFEILPPQKDQCKIQTKDLTAYYFIPLIEKLNPLEVYELPINICINDDPSYTYFIPPYFSKKHIETYDFVDCKDNITYPNTLTTPIDYYNMIFSFQNSLIRKDYDKMVDYGRTHFNSFNKNIQNRLLYFINTSVPPTPTKNHKISGQLNLNNEFLSNTEILLFKLPKIDDKPFTNTVIDTIKKELHNQIFTDNIELLDYLFNISHISITKTDNKGNFIFKNTINGTYILGIIIPKHKELKTFKIEDLDIININNNDIDLGDINLSTI